MPAQETRVVRVPLTAVETSSGALEPVMARWAITTSAAVRFDAAWREGPQSPVKSIFPAQLVERELRAERPLGPGGFLLLRFDNRTSAAPVEIQYTCQIGDANTPTSPTSPEDVKKLAARKRMEERKAAKQLARRQVGGLQLPADITASILEFGLTAAAGRRRPR